MKNATKCHISKTAPKFNRKIIEREANSIPKDNFPVMANALPIKVAEVQTPLLIK
jgi:hypothetical protein